MADEEITTLAGVEATSRLIEQMARFMADAARRQDLEGIKHEAIPIIIEAAAIARYLVRAEGGL